MIPLNPGNKEDLKILSSILQKKVIKIIKNFPSRISAVSLHHAAAEVCSRVLMIKLWSMKGKPTQKAPSTTKIRP
jgi:hypothetical protein